ncbi:MAG: flagellar biosynthesis anti-sigma factor FlgM [Pseudomonadota bacterium]
MTNRIGPVDQSSIGKLGNKVDDAGLTRASGGEKAPANTGTGAAAVGGETVNLTSGGQLLSRLEQSRAAAPAVDSGKVAEVKAAIASGNFEIDSTAVADAMLRFERSLGE